VAEPTTGGETSTGIVIPAAAGPGAKQESSPTDIVLKVLGAIGTGIGILGFVTFFGGAIIWVRADKAELPATEAVAVVPRSVLITTGATFLFPALLIAAGVVAVIFLVHLIFRLVEECKLRPKRKQAKALQRVAAQTGRAAVAAQQAWKAAQAVFESQRDELKAAHEREAPGSEISDLEAKVRTQRLETERLQAAAEGAVSAAATARGNADNLTEESEERLERGWVQWTVELTAAGIALGIIVPVINKAIFHTPCGLEVAALVLAAVAGTAITLLVYWETQKFIWFGVVAFIAVGVYLAAATYFSTHRNAKMQPVAALRTGHAPVVGSYIASTSESLYVGTFREPETPPRLVVIPRAQVTEMVIGPLLDQNLARRRAITMALNECAQEVAVPEAEAPRPPPEYEPACTEPQINALNAALKH
jgi:hypothetical protein